MPSDATPWLSERDPLSLISWPFDAELHQLATGKKDVVKREKVPRELLAHTTAEFEAAGFRVVAPPELTYDAPHGDGHDYTGDSNVTVFVARDHAAAARAAALSVAEMRAGRDAAAQAALITELGALLGYPPCCVAAYAATMAATDLGGGRAALHLAPLHRTRGAPDPLLNYVATDVRLTSHVPCAFDCPPSVALAAHSAAAFAAGRPALAADRARARARPLLFLDADRFVAFDGAALDGPTLTYTAALRGSVDPDEAARPPTPGFAALLDALARGDRLTWWPGLTTVHAGPTELARFHDVEPLLAPFLIAWSEPPRWRRPPRFTAAAPLDAPPARRAAALALAADLARHGLHADPSDTIAAGAPPAPSAAITRDAPPESDDLEPLGPLATGDRRDALVAALAALARRFDRHPPPPGAAPLAPPPPGSPPRRPVAPARFGPLTAGAPLSARWRVEALARRPHAVVVALASTEPGDDARVLFNLAPATPDAPPSPFDLGPLAISYQPTPLPLTRVVAAARPLRAALRRAGALDPARVAAWFAAPPDA